MLVEAVLSAIVIATGLVCISRGLASQLTALRSVEEYDTLLTLAREQWLELEAERLAGLAPIDEREGALTGPGHEQPDAAYRWRIAATRRADPRGEPLFSEVTLTVQHTGGVRAPSITQSAVWPSKWVPRAWLE